MDYRREVDGLRALAVLPVILFHAGIHTFGGGFVGVDIFFVISGYLITSIIVGDLRRDKFSIIDFYERRARRILPALFVVVIVAILFAYLWMLPDDLENFGQSVVATSLSANNILLSITTGYWERAAEFKPLLHTWSLGVEEQYYFIIPILLLAVHKFMRRALVPLLALAFMASLALCVLWSVKFPTANFYLLPTRAWELLLGSLVALYLLRMDRNTFSRTSCEVGSLLGTALILYSIFFFSASTPAPSLYILAPTLGAALLIIFTRPDVIVFRVLGSRLAVGLGLVSYSAYLWHWPLFAFARIYSVSAPPITVMLALAAMSIVLAYFSWQFVEQPFRDRKRFSRAFVMTGAPAMSLLLIAAGYYLHKSHGVPGRMYSEDLASANEMYISYNQSAFVLKTDHFRDDGGTKLLVSGDSFARDFVNMVRENFDSSRVDMIYRDDLRPCTSAEGNKKMLDLFAAADVVVYVFAEVVFACVQQDIDLAKSLGKSIYFVGSKQFGQNLNWLVRVPARAAHFYTIHCCQRLSSLKRGSKEKFPRNMYFLC